MGDVFYQVRERLLTAGLLVLMVQGLDDNEIDSRLSSGQAPQRKRPVKSFGGLE